MQNAVQALRMLYATSPAVTWDVANALLPTSHGITSPTPTPTYREHLGKPEVTRKEYWEFVRAVVEMMTEWAGNKATRWAALVGAYPEVRRGYPEVGKLITDALDQVDPNSLAEGNEAVVHNALKGLISHHREYPDAEWALPDADLQVLAGLQVRFEPTDAVLLHSHLFSWHPKVTDAPMRQHEDGWDEWLLEKQVQVVEAVYGQDGVPGIIRLAKAVELPWCVGLAAAQMCLPDGDEARLLQEGLSVAPNDTRNGAMMAARSYVASKFRQAGEKWLEAILARPTIAWTPEAHANLALGLPTLPSIWERLERWGGEADRLYWRNVEIRGSAQEHWQHVLGKWHEVGRPWSSLELVARLVDERRPGSASQKPSVEQVMDILEEALSAGEGTEPLRQHGQMLDYYAERLFLFLDTQDVVSERMARLEWGWLRVLEHTKRGVKALQRQVTSSPELFVELLTVLFRAEGEQKDKDVSDDQRRIAEQAFHLLQDIHRIPGCHTCDAGEVVDAGALRQWVLKARELAQNVGRLRVCDSQVGQILSYAPASPDGSWPCVEVRDLIEELQSQGIENGLSIGKRNQRGAVWRGKDGQQEWGLAKEYRGLADKVRVRWPRTASILDDLAKGYENEARHWDEQAKREEYE
jgi:hypothetical protein